MTPKEKAEELVNKFFNYCSYEDWEGKEGHKENMKQCALIAVDELIKESEMNHLFLNAGVSIYYWQEVKQEILKL